MSLYFIKRITIFLIWKNAHILSLICHMCIFYTECTLRFALFVLLWLWKNHSNTIMQFILTNVHLLALIFYFSSINLRVMRVKLHIVLFILMIESTRCFYHKSMNVRSFKTFLVSRLMPDNFVYRRHSKFAYV